jgi:DNA-binding LacI/PurR family transcriptional regulator
MVPNGLSEECEVRRKSPKVGFEQVAREAHVSIATVSRVVHGNQNVSRVSRERVMGAATKLGLDLDGKRKPKIIAFILSNRGVLHPFHSAVLVGAEACCAAHEYGVLFLPVRYPPDVEWRKLHLPPVLQRRDIVRAAIVAGTNSQNLLDFLSHKGVSFVVLGNNVAGPWRKEECNAVYFDDVEGAFGVTRYLQSLGHRDIWYVGNCKMPWFSRRYEGYRKAMEEAGLQARKSEADSDNAEDVGFLATKPILNGRASVTAIFAGDDTAARGVYKALREAGVGVPDDVSVAGFNDIPEAAAFNPPLTSVRVFTDQVGKQMAERLLKEIADPASPPEIINIPTQLVKRESCGPPPDLVAAQRRQTDAVALPAVSG